MTDNRDKMLLISVCNSHLNPLTPRIKNSPEAIKVVKLKLFFWKPMISLL